MYQASMELMETQLRIIEKEKLKSVRSNYNVL